MCVDEGGDVGDIPVERSSFERFEGLRRPPQFITECDADPPDMILPLEGLFDQVKDFFQRGVQF